MQLLLLMQFTVLTAVLRTSLDSQLETSVMLPSIVGGCSYVETRHYLRCPALRCAVWGILRVEPRLFLVCLLQQRRLSDISRNQTGSCSAARLQSSDARRHSTLLASGLAHFCLGEKYISRKEIFAFVSDRILYFRFKL